MLFFTTTTAILSLLTLATALPSNNHANKPARRAHHFGRHAPHGAQVHTTEIQNTAGNSSEIDEGLVKRGAGVVDIQDRGIAKRAFSGMRATYYGIGLGACGQYDSEPAYVVALNSAQYGGGYPGPQCFKSITITGGPRNGHAVATIKDECPTCPYGGLDMSEALFSNFASADDGVATITWWFNDEAPPAPAPAPTTSTTPAYTPPATTHTEPAYTPPTTSSTPAYTPPPSSTYTPPTSSSVYTPPPSTSSTSIYVAPTTSSTPPPATSSTPASSSAPSSSVVSTTRPLSSTASALTASSTSSSSGGLVLSSLVLGKSASSVTRSASATAAAASTGSTDAPESDDSGMQRQLTGAHGNLEMLADVTLQLGNMIVLSAQQAGL